MASPSQLNPNSNQQPNTKLIDLLQEQNNKTSPYGNMFILFLFIGFCVLLGYTIDYHNKAKECENKSYHHFCPSYHCPDGSTPENCTHT